MVGFIHLYKILSLGLAYPEEQNWALIEKQFTMSADLFGGELAQRVEQFRISFSENRSNIERIQSEYLAIFDVGRKISPYETEYITEKVSRKPFELADIAGFYTAFGFAVHETRKNKEAPDHISIELEFMAILEWKTEYAREKKEDENATIVSGAKLKFLKDHLLKWGFFFCKQISGLEGNDFYKRLALIFELVLLIECERYGLDPSLFEKELQIDPFSGVRGEELTC
ncbi:MAG: hypothetical protein GY799_10175 [Desulfobulbaceae bacterium]|nr:hypothetical protein [Desulfobulbaceae bacterium]